MASEAIRVASTSSSWYSVSKGIVVIEFLSACTEKVRKRKREFDFQNAVFGEEKFFKGR